MNFRELKIGELVRSEDEGAGCFVYEYSNVREKSYFSFLAELTACGYTKKEEYEILVNSFSAFEKDGELVLTSYYPKSNKTIIVSEPNSTYFNFKDTPKNEKVQPLYTQIDLEDFGESVVVRLADGRFIVYDGGREFPPDADKLVSCLREQSPHEKPIVAAWIMTHPHCDHYRCFLIAYRNYPDAFTVEKFIYNFTDTEDKDIERIPTLVKDREWLRDFEKEARETGATMHKAHTGQVYNVGGACLEILSSPDNTLIPPVRDVNALSLVIKMTVEGQPIMMCADSNLNMTTLAEDFGGHLKSDILQPTHHMFLGGNIRTYDLIDPKVCIVPSFEADVFARISPYQNKCKKENLHLFYNMNVEEFYTGSTGNVVLPLPYTPKQNGRKEYLEKLEAYRKAAGAKTWYFIDMYREDCRFTFLNTTVEVANVSADLYFEDKKNLVLSIKFPIEAMQTTKINILDDKTVDADALFYNNHSLAKKGVPGGVPFTVCFNSDIPLIIKGKKTADYHS